MDLTIDDLWQAKHASQANLKKSVRDDDENSGSDDDDNIDHQHAAFRQQVDALVALYGEGVNGDLFIRRIKNNVLIDFEGIPFAFPRLIANGKFIQVVSPGLEFRLEFKIEKRLADDGKCTLTLEERPEDLVTGGGSFQEIEKLLDSSEWTTVKPVRLDMYSNRSIKLEH